ncbi:Lipid A 3-O-deacylase (PagL) [Trichlorobacter thiogenes]|uniref:Lipid A 3-O-deacylase (PagL) n=1 Tax=Trichlorobacter thiogenes TaxID=115783 RepID=A0A1T4QQX0_9BACT|nr:acyloxyacyl hydrolase [Trichlorobacter thiogenes]SKA06179.1 Lipid A 3-O-deacylase (PagL) [Trichlorobacter thiogenes]
MVKTILTLLLTVLITSSALADNQIKTTADASYELTLLTGYGITHRGFGETRTQVQTWDAIARLGWYLSDDIGKGSWYQGRHQLLVELPYHLAVDHGGRSIVGGYLLGSWKFTSLSHVKPYIFAGGGPVYVGLGLPTMGAKLNFSYQGGTGVQIPIAQATMLNLEYRYHHISNAGTASPNEPLNSSKFLLGMSWLY